ncbi:aminotransferase class IV [Candidatus Eisenbacteria bacterium]|uniref:Aminotransferase class IV n=1 Tax=Eiseniibacteriota bacterium TaxID=2212470 RepID=A0ABV6YL77_UNCEI
MWAVLNGEFVRKEEERIRLEDRGLTFGDGLFEVLRTVNGRLLFFDEHIERMVSSAEHFGFPLPWRPEEVEQQALELIRRNGIKDGECYLQLTRGADRNRGHKYPPTDTAPTFFILAFPLRRIDPANWERGAKLFTYPDLRHQLCTHKTLNLLPNVMAKNHAYDRGGYEALMFREDEHGRYVTEGGSSSYFCVADGRILVPEVDNILPGITRGKIIRMAKNLGHEVEERRLYLSDLLAADEVLLTSTISKVMPVRAVDDARFAAPGKITELLQATYERLFRQQLGLQPPSGAIP